MKIIIITGTPGTGKTALSKKLASKLDFHYIDVNRMISKYGVSEGYDKKRKTKIVDIKKLNKMLIREINSIKNANKDATKHPKQKNKPNKKSKSKIIAGVIIDSHLSHYLPKKYADLCIVTKCSLKVQQKRLKKRKYSNEKIRENLDAEIFDVCLNEARENGHKIIVFDTTKGIGIDKICNKIKHL
ncbi:adenylate kinase family protein [Candidatus Woesearchaeota archaeon]|nr:adenylate kinase family protein [Candidatus Woesearchaeota archaeon]